MRLLAIPWNEASGGFPFPLLPRVAQLKEGFLARLPNYVDNWSLAYFERLFRDGHHNGLNFFSSVQFFFPFALLVGSLPH